MQSNIFFTCCHMLSHTVPYSYIQLHSCTFKHCTASHSSKQHQKHQTASTICFQQLQTAWNSIQKHQTSSCIMHHQTNQNTNKETQKHRNKETKEQRSKETSKQASKHACMHASIHPSIHLQHTASWRISEPQPSTCPYLQHLRAIYYLQIIKAYGYRLYTTCLFK